MRNTLMLASLSFIVTSALVYWIFGKYDIFNFAITLACTVFWYAYNREEEE